MTTLDAALLRAVSAHPDLTFAGLLDAVRLDVGATEIDAAARALGLEHGEPGAYRYRLPGSAEARPDAGERVADEVLPHAVRDDRRGVDRLRVEGALNRGTSEHGLDLPLGRLDDVPEERLDISARGIVHPDTIASSPAQSTLPGIWR